MPDATGIADGLWLAGANSLMEPGALLQGEYQWSINAINRGGMLGTRPGLGLVGQMIWGLGEPQALIAFKPVGRPIQLIAAVGGKILRCDFPFLTWSIVPNIAFSPTGPIVFCVGKKSVERQSDQTLKVVNSYPVLIIQDNMRQAGVWDGMTARHSNPSPGYSGIPIGLWMAWSGSRLWVGSGSKLFASDLKDPTSFTETNYLSEGGYFDLPDEIKGIGQTADLRTLLVGTDTTVTSFLSNIRDRNQWADTPDFQKILFPGIGVVAGKSFVNQYGLTWWFSHGGVIALDSAQQTYRSSRVHYRDQNMMRSKSNLASDLSKICGGTFENFLFYSVPSGDRHNAHSWALDQAPVDTLDTPGSPAWTGAWNGIRPVEWASVVVNGRNRCFCLSRDYVPGSNRQFTYNVWEAFTPQRRDVSHNRVAKRISCGFETKRLGAGPNLMRFSHALLDCTEISGTVDLSIYYAGTRGGYKLIGSKRIVASSGSIRDGTRITSASRIEAFRPQDRLVRTMQVEGGIDEINNNKIESPLNGNVDRGFSILVKWEGQLTVRGLEIFVEPEPDKVVGACEDVEATERYVTIAGRGEILADADTNHPAMGRNTSDYVRVLTPRWIETPYESLSNINVEAPRLPVYDVLVAPIVPSAPAPTLVTWMNPPLDPPPVGDPPPPAGDDNPPGDGMPIDDLPPYYWPNHPGYIHHVGPPDP